MQFLSKWQFWWQINIVTTISKHFIILTLSLVQLLLAFERWKLHRKYIRNIQFAPLFGHKTIWKAYSFVSPNPSIILTNLTWFNSLVKPSASIRSVGTNSTLISLFSIYSQIAWYQTWICLIQKWKIDRFIHSHSSHV